MYAFRLRHLVPALGLIAGIALHGGASAQASNLAPVPADILNLDATVSSEVAPDLSVVVLAATREGPDAAVLTQDVNQIMTQALALAKATSGVQTATGAYSSARRYDNKGQPTVWVVRAELVLKSRDFVALGRLAGKLSSTMQIAGNGFEVSPELRDTEEAHLVTRGVAAFRAKADAAARAFGYKGVDIREVTVGSANQSGGPRPVALMKAMAAPLADGAPMAIDGGRVTLQLGVSGAVRMLR